MQGAIHNITKGNQQNLTETQIQINHAFWSLSYVKQNRTRHIHTQAIKTKEKEYASICIGFWILDLLSNDHSNIYNYIKLVCSEKILCNL